MVREFLRQHPPRIGARRVQYRAARAVDGSRVLARELQDVSGIIRAGHVRRAFPALAKSDHFASEFARAIDHRFDHRVQARYVAATGENADLISLSHTPLPLRRFICACPLSPLNCANDSRSFAMRGCRARNAVAVLQRRSGTIRSADCSGEPPNAAFVSRFSLDCLRITARCAGRARGESARNLFHRRRRRAIDADRRSAGRVAADRHRLGRFPRARREPHPGGRERRGHRPHRRPRHYALSLRSRRRSRPARKPHQDRRVFRSRPQHGSAIRAAIMRSTKR